MPCGDRILLGADAQASVKIYPIEPGRAVLQPLGKRASVNSKDDQFAALHSTRRARGCRVRFGPNGVHLFDRASGLNVLLDEVRAPKPLWARVPRFVSIALTNACDLSCPYCYAPKDSSTLKCDEILSWLVDLDHHGCLGVGFGGGEPTLHPNFVEICRAAAERTALAITFTTHAHRLSKPMLSGLMGSIHFVRVSMDGVGQTYEALRGRSFQHLEEQLGLVRSLAPFGINYVVNEQTLPDLDRAVQLAARLGASEFLLLPQARTAALPGIDQDLLDRLRIWVRNSGPRPRLSISEAYSVGFPTCNPFGQESSLDAYCHIDAAGFLKTNSFDIVGQPIGAHGILDALETLRRHEEKN